MLSMPREVTGQHGVTSRPLSGVMLPADVTAVWAGYEGHGTLTRHRRSASGQHPGQGDTLSKGDTGYRTGDY